VSLDAVHADWRRCDGSFDVALAADVHEARNVEPSPGCCHGSPGGLVGLADGLRA
jgi:hypothetical protein